MQVKSLMAGLLIGATITTGIHVYADHGAIQAFIRNDVQILVDGVPLKIPADRHILSYEGYFYTPARSVAEALGAKVSWVDSRNAVLIQAPEPEIVEVEIEKIVYKEAETENKTVYNRTPVRLRQQDNVITITGINRGTNTGIYFDWENKGAYASTLDYQNAYVLIDGEKYEENLNNGWMNMDIPPNVEMQDLEIYFTGIDPYASKMTIVLPIKHGIISENGYELVTNVFTFDVDFGND